jgi:hypothetical protein
MSGVNFKLVSEFQVIQRRPFELADLTILNPNSANPILDGEFLRLNTSYKMYRDTVNPSVIPSYCYFAERGRYETQAIGKGPFLYMGWYEADTKIMDATGLGIGSYLEVDDVSIGGVNKRALKLQTTGYAVGVVTRLPADNGGWLRFIRIG